MENLPALWVKKHKIKNEVGVELDFSKRSFLWDIYNDLSPKQALLKPPQIGATVMNTLKSLWVAKKLNRQIIYTLPTQGDIQAMVGGSFNRIIAQNPILREWIKDHDTIEQKTVGDSIIFYRGTWVAKAAMMIPSGLNIHDEVDASDPAVITAYENRLQAQEDGGMRWYFSHPTIAGHGVDVYWSKSDKKEWHITCPHCAEQQVLTWPDNIDMDKEIFICAQCKGELSVEDRIHGVWKNQDGVEWTGEIIGDYEFSGWHVSQLMLHNKTASDIIAVFNDPMKDSQFFYNYVLGLPYIGSEDVIQPRTVLKNCVDRVNTQEHRTVIGVDTGHGIHLTLMNKDGIFYYENDTEITASRTPYDTVRSMLHRFPRSVAVFDQGGDLIGVRQLQKEFPGRIFLCFYTKNKKSKEIIEWKKGDRYGEVHVDRNRMIQLIVEQMRDVGRFRLNGTPDEWSEFAEQFGNIYREKIVVRAAKDKDDRTLYGNEYVWKRKGHDHYVHALLYAYVGMQKFSGDLATVVEAGGGELPTGQVVEVDRDGVSKVAVSPKLVDDSMAKVVATVPRGAFSSDNAVDW